MPASYLRCNSASYLRSRLASYKGCHAISPPPERSAFPVHGRELTRRKYARPLPLHPTIRPASSTPPAARFRVGDPDGDQRVVAQAKRRLPRIGGRRRKSKTPPVSLSLTRTASSFLLPSLHRQTSRATARTTGHEKPPILYCITPGKSTPKGGGDPALPASLIPP